MKVTASACAKTILFGEHAVVYGEPACAIPLPNVRTRVEIEESDEPFRVISPAIFLNQTFEMLNAYSGLTCLLEKLRSRLELEQLPRATLTIDSDIPIASGLGSGAALSAAIIRAFLNYTGQFMSTDEINEITYTVEKIYHGNPSGIDNTTIVYEQPMLFVRGEPFTPICCDVRKLPLLVIDSGIRSCTIDVVSDVRSNYEKNAAAIREIGQLVRETVPVLEAGDIPAIGEAMNRNQELLRAIDVSCPELDESINLARSLGAVGAKLTGAGRGGNFLVLAKDFVRADELRNIFKEKGLNVIA